MPATNDVGAGHARDRPLVDGNTPAGSTKNPAQQSIERSGADPALRAAYVREIVGNDFTDVAASAQGCAEA